MSKQSTTGNDGFLENLALLRIMKVPAIGPLKKFKKTYVTGFRGVLTGFGNHKPITL